MCYIEKDLPWYGYEIGSIQGCKIEYSRKWMKYLQRANITEQNKMLQN